MLVNLKKLFTYDIVADPGFSMDFDDDILTEYNQNCREQKLNTVLCIIDPELDKWIEDSTSFGYPLPFTKQMWFSSH